ncbi:radical SAM/SPASM domain-containing protein [Fusibacter sp. JL216-2]|uniref:radical SAM/SPASM domain-containing protein n=1 Tax=Fusibacter sp. JL216-2 TaxID=3071453 RepID=UPI003D3506EC
MKKFKRIFIEISNICNLACSFCPPSKRSKKMMTLTEFEHVLKSIEGHGDHIYLHVKGEPLFHKDFEGILSLCTKYGKKTNITTNGSLLDQHGDAILNTPAVRLVNISLQSFEGVEDQEAYRVYLEKVLNFVKKGQRQTDKIFELRLWNFDEKASPENDLKHAFIKSIEDFLEEKVAVTTQNTKGLSGRHRVFISKGKEFEWPSLDNDFVGTRGTCFGMRHQVAVLSDGSVVPCCLDAEGLVALGNIFNESFKNIIESPRAQAIKTGFQNRKVVEDLCQRCSYREVYVTK